MRKTLASIAAILFMVGCGDGATGKGEPNNGATNNGSTNNGATNNGATNNGATNNGATNNGATNNGATNNGSSNNGVANNGIVPDGVQALEDGLWNSLCEAMFQCPNRNTAQLIVFVGGRFATEAECKASPYRGDVDMVQAQLGIDAGRAVYDASKTEACAEAFKTVWCDPLADPTPIETGCTGIWTGQVAEAGSCATNDECVEGTFCNFSGDECFGACQSVPDATVCGDEMCDLATEYCGRQGQSQTCQPRKTDGDACGSDAECSDGSGCLGGAGGDFCTPFNSLGEGEICSGQGQFCQSDLVCVGQRTQTCEPLSFGVAGDTCTFDGRACEAGLACLNLGFSGGTCGAARGEGQSCQISFQCQIGLYCDGFDFAMPQELGSCLPRKADGGECTENDQCESESCIFATAASETGTCGAKMYCEIP